MITDSYKPGLEGVVAGTTTICSVDSERNRLCYRGYDVRDFVLNHTAYEEVAYLLLNEKLPNRSELEIFQQTLAANRTLPESVLGVLRQLPKAAHPMEHLRAGVDVLVMQDPDRTDSSHEANIRKATRLLAQVPVLVAANHRLSQGLPLIEPADSRLTLAENFLYMLSGEMPSPVRSRIFNATLVLYAEHGFNASTFTARVVASTQSDLHSALSAAIGALKGPLHGGANEKAMNMLLEIGGIEKVDAFVADALAAKKKIMGFGHREYKTCDPRAVVLKGLARDLANELGDTQWLDMGDRVEALLSQEKGLFPNVDFPIGYIYYMLGIPTPVYTPIFALGRVAGWTAHIIEQLDNNRLIRPKVIYEGPDSQTYLPLDERP
ncbi:MAG: citrate/2-methylcitrate synthase [Candidatus Melainabacteria bacterium]|nr:citrate/2-methylcitrate synthase [Candidatus Melainabacteria bacterium]